MVVIKQLVVWRQTHVDHIPVLQLQGEGVRQADVVLSGLDVVEDGLVVVVHAHNRQLRGEIVERCEREVIQPSQRSREHTYRWTGTR